MTKRIIRCLAVVGIALMLFLAFHKGQAVAGEGEVTVAGDEAFVYLFDPDTAAFVFTFTLPTSGASPWDIEAISNGSRQDVWFTEPSIDRIGHLVYTGTQDYTFQEYVVEEGCYPLNLAINEGFVWFTESKCNRIGRLEIGSGITTEFEIETLNSYPADLFIDPDGSIWFTEMQADQLAHLVITSTTQYTIEEYQGVGVSGGHPYGVVRSGSGIYIAQPANDKVMRFTPAAGMWTDVSTISGLNNVQEPYKLVIDNFGKVWGTERAGNRITKFTYGTFPVVTPYDVTPAGSLLTGFAVGQGDALWFTQWAAGQMGKFSTISEEMIYYPLPLDNLAPTGVAVDDNSVWLLATRIYRVYLPLSMRGG